METFALIGMLTFFAFVWMKDSDQEREEIQELIDKKIKAKSL